MILTTPFRHVARCFPYRDQGGETDAAYVARLEANLDAAFVQAGAGRVAAFFAETVVGATTGCVAAVPGYFAAVRRVCDRHGALLILDEVMCGMGRTGTLHAWEQEQVTPDIQIVAKGLAGGYQPIGGMLVSEQVVAALRAGSGAFVHGQTYQAHPVACAAALEVQRVVAQDGLVQRASSLGQHLSTALRSSLGEHRHVGDIRGRGLFWAVEFVADRGSKAPFDPHSGMHAVVGRACMAHGLVTYSMGGAMDGLSGDHVMLAPAYIAAPQDIDEIVERFSAAVRSVFK